VNVTYQSIEVFKYVYCNSKSIYTIGYTIEGGYVYWNSSNSTSIY